MISKVCQDPVVVLHARHRSVEKVWRGLSAVLVRQNQRESLLPVGSAEQGAVIVDYRVAHGLAADEIVEVKLSSSRANVNRTLT